MLYQDYFTNCSCWTSCRCSTIWPWRCYVLRRNFHSFYTLFYFNEFKTFSNWSNSAIFCRPKNQRAWWHLDCSAVDSRRATARQQSAGLILFYIELLTFENITDFITLNYIIWILIDFTHWIYISLRLYCIVLLGIYIALNLYYSEITQHLLIDYYWLLIIDYYLG